MIGIYKITNQINHRVYIGQSVNIKQRWRKHKYDAQTCNKNYDYPLYKAFRKYGIENFKFEIVEQCSVNELNDREKYWIAYYGSNIKGYNQTEGGFTPTYQKITPEILQNIVNELMNDHMILHADIAKKYNVSVEMIQGINTGRYWYNSKLSYPLQGPKAVNKKHQAVDKYCPICKTKITRHGYMCRRCANISQYKTSRPDKESLLEQIVSSSFTAVAKKYGVSDKAIVKWCKSYGLPTHKKELVALYKDMYYNN